MNIPLLMSTKERTKILDHILFKTDPIHVSETARQLKLSKGLISKYFDLLKDNKILERKGRAYTLNHNQYTRALKIIFNLTKLDITPLQQSNIVMSAGLYGSCARGENTEDSDIDLYVITKKSDAQTLGGLSRSLRDANKDLNEDIDEKIKPLYLTEEKIKQLQIQDPLFHHALVFGSITLYGEGIGNRGIQKMLEEGTDQ